MNRTINRIKIFPNNDEKSIMVLNKLKKELVKRKFEIVDDDFNLGIAIGGDGSFLRMIRNCNFNSDVYYIGINTGTLGFLQEIDYNKINEFIDRLDKNDFKVENIGIQETMIYSNNNIHKFDSLNEIVIKRIDFNTANINVYIDNVFLEKFCGDGLLISTSTGSTAHNLSYHGSIVYNLFHSLQITPMGPINNNSYKCLSNSVVLPENLKITIIPDKNSKNLFVLIDGKCVKYDNVDKIETTVRNKKIKCLRMNEYNYPKIINDKFLK